MFHGKLVHLHRTAEMSDEAGNAVRARVSIRKEELPELHHGTTVRAQIHCGRRSLGYVWFRDVLDTVYGQILLWL